MSDPAESRDPLDALGEEFLERVRRGERPDPSEFAARAPGLEGEVREFLAALLMVEGLKPQVDETVDAARPSATAAGPVADRLGDFRILRELGRGGMGIVYEAEQESLGRHVALKVLAPGVARSPHQVRRFVREARSAARLHHTNIVPVFGVGEHDGLHYYAMQYIPGLGLDKVLEEVRRLKGRGPAGPGAEASSARRVDADGTATLVNSSTGPGRAGRPAAADGAGDAPASRPSTLAVATDSDARYARGVARIGLQVAEALEYAHQQGTLHRDVKPSNILLDLHGVAWVTDFGLAKAAEDEDLTRTGDLLGTVRYMAPERFRGLADARADVYGLGLVLYELLALRPAFVGSDREGLLEQVHRVEPPRLGVANPAVPRDLETIVHKAIEKDPAHRYADAAALAEDLRRFLEDRPIVARRVGPVERLARWARRNPGLSALGAALAGMLVLVAAVLVAADLRLRREHAETLSHLGRAERAEAAALSRLLDSSIDHARASRRSRFAGRRAEGLRAIGEAARLDPSGSRRLELRNEAIACLAMPDLSPMPPWPGRPEDGYLGVDLDPASGRIARGTPDGTVLIRDVGADGEPERLPGNGLRVVFLRFSPDGRHLAVKHEGRDRLVLVVWDLDRRAKILDLADAIYADAVDFHTGAGLVATGRRDGSIVLFDLPSGRELRRLAPGTVARSIRFDPSGRRIAAVSPNSREGAQVRSVDDGSVLASWVVPEPAYSLEWRPDGRRLAVGALDGRVRLFDPDDPGAPPRLLGGHDGQVIALAFHPAGALLASASWDGTVRLWDARTGQELVKGPLPDPRPIRFSRDGRSLGPGHDAGSSWLWEVAEGAECRSLVGPDGEGARTWSVDFLDGLDVLASAGWPGVRLEPLARGGRPAFLALPGTAASAVVPDGSSLLTTGTAGPLRWPIRRPSAGELRIGPPAPLGPLAGVPTGRSRLARDGRTLAAVIDDERGRVLILDLEGIEPAVEIAGHPGLERLALSPDGRWAATGTWHGDGVKVWDARGGTLVRDLPVEGNAEVVFSPDGGRLVTASGSEYAIWESGTWAERLRIPRSHAGGLPGVAAFSPDGRVLAIARTRSTVQLVDAATGRELATLEPPEPRNVAGLGFTPDGRSLVATFNDPSLQVWDLAAIRSGLARLGLDWPAPTSPAPSLADDPGGSTIVVEPPSWLEPLARGESRARAGRWDESAAAFDEAIAAGAPHVEPRLRRILFLRSRGDEAAYREACRDLLRTFDPARVLPRTVNDLAWACALGPGAVEDYEPLIRLARSAAASRPEPNRLNTLGALLYRGGRLDEAIRQLEHSVDVHGAGGTAYDALFLAMAHGRLGHLEEARRWYDRGAEAPPVGMHKPDASGDTSWIPRLELEVLRREAASVLGPAGP